MAFKERRTLQQLEFGLNHVTMDKKQLVAAVGKDLEKEACEAASSTKEFKIDIPELHQDFQIQGVTKTKIYPLPISHENQCSILGAAANLDLFAQEFGFPQADSHIPFNRSKKEFDLERAYERYAFLKSYAKHQEQQKEYEQVLRGQDADDTAAANEYLDVVVMLSESDSDAES